MQARESLFYNIIYITEITKRAMHQITGHIITTQIMQNKSICIKIATSNCELQRLVFKKSILKSHKLVPMVFLCHTLGSNLTTFTEGFGALSLSHTHTLSLKGVILLFYSTFR